MQPLLSQEEAVVRARAGDVAAYSQLVEAHQEASFRAALVILHDAAAAEDVAQEGLIRAYEKLDAFQDGQPFRPWLLRIVTNLALNELRRRRRGLAVLERFGRQPRTSPPVPEVIVAESEQTRRVWSAMNCLSSDDRVILYLRYFLELGEAEMATVIGKRQGTVKSRLHRAMKRLRAIIEHDFPDLRSQDD